MKLLERNFNKDITLYSKIYKAFPKRDLFEILTIALEKGVSLYLYTQAQFGNYDFDDNSLLNIIRNDKEAHVSKYDLCLLDSFNKGFFEITEDTISDLIHSEAESFGFVHEIPTYEKVVLVFEPRAGLVRFQELIGIPFKYDHLEKKIVTSFKFKTSDIYVKKADIHTLKDTQKSTELPSLTIPQENNLTLRDAIIDTLIDLIEEDSRDGNIKPTSHLKILLGKDTDGLRSKNLALAVKERASKYQESVDEYEVNTIARKIGSIRKRFKK